MLREVGFALPQSDDLPDHGGDGRGTAAEAEMAQRVARLTRGQLDCLLLVDQHLSSKEIAAELNISPHTVDQRIRVALQTLGVDRRTHAARLVARSHEPYQRLIHQSPYIETESFDEQSDG